MSQRSQIYVRINGKLVVPQDYGWNYAERMISRAKGILEFIECKNGSADRDTAHNLFDRRI